MNQDKIIKHIKSFMQMPNDSDAQFIIYHLVNLLESRCNVTSHVIRNMLIADGGLTTSQVHQVFTIRDTVNAELSILAAS